MKAVEFCYWLQGLFELAEPTTLSAHQTDLIKKHLNLVFYHDIDPGYSDDPDEQKKLNEIHSGPLEQKPIEELLGPQQPVYNPPKPPTGGGWTGGGGPVFRC